MAIKNTVTTKYTSLKSHYTVRNAYSGFRVLYSDPLTRLAMFFLGFIFLLGVFGPILAPHEPGETLYHSEGGIIRSATPSLEHPLGTNHLGQDIFSRVLIGARPTMLTGLLVGVIMFIIGVTVGTTAGYVGGQVDDVLMRFTDFMYSIPVLPASIVLVALLGGGFYMTILILGLLLWRGMARVLRSQVLQIKERPFVLAARSTGAGTPRILLKHIFPNVAPMAILFTAIGAGYSIIIQAGLAFLGITDPYTPTWGVILRNAYNSGLMAELWWWSLVPGLMISFTVLSAFLIGRGYEDLSGEENDEMMVA